MAGLMAARTIEELDRMSGAAFVEAVAPWFEGALRYLRRLAAERPYRTWDAFWGVARTVAYAMPEAEQVELIDAHPRLGAPPGSVSAMSFVEQGYDRETADAAAEAERRRVDDELLRLNEAYEAKFGFRFCIFVAGRPRRVLLPIFEDALERPRDKELRRALIAVVDIAEDRWLKQLNGEAT
jgi:2-oxo-4-hydroxy-4-carboxy--5-ureidoimidazoline (OHCU) decarboxylase